jgi:ribosomal protein S8
MSDPLDERLERIRECVQRRRATLTLVDTVRTQPRPVVTRRTSRPRRWESKRYAILTQVQEDEIAVRLKNGETEMDLARAFHVSKGTTRRIRVQRQIPYRGRPGRMIPVETRAQVLDALRSRQGTCREIAARFGICKATLGKIKREMVSA